MAMSASLLWRPNEAHLRESRMALFRDRFSSLVGEPLLDYESFYASTVKHYPDFWRLWLEQSGMLFEGSPQRAYLPNASGEVYGGQWFPDIQLNFAANLLARLDDEPLIGRDELGRRRTWTKARVLNQVAELATLLRAQGVGPGDRVAGFMPNVPESILAMLATTGLGAMWSSCSPDFGVQGVLDRFGQIEPKVLFVTDGTVYGGKRIDLTQKTRDIVSKLPSLRAVVRFPFLDSASLPPTDTDWIDAGALLESAPADEPRFDKFPFETPAYILYSSGTTGQPKCIVHGAGGTLLQHSKELILHSDLRAGEKIFYYTTCGWMMWNWVVTSLLVGAKLVTYEGSPFAPIQESLWDMVNDEGIQVFGTSAKFLSACRTSGVHPRAGREFRALRLVLSTGSPLLPEDFDWFYQEVAPNNAIPIASISGGTDIVSCFMLGTPLKPVVRGEIQGRGLGLGVESFDSQGQPVRGRQGELVCTNPFPSMPVGFWNDAGHAKYRKAYFERFPGVWHHGDFVTITNEGGVVMHGRSDATLNPGGVRIGTAEIYQQTESHPAVADSLATGQLWKGDERIVLFVKLREGHRFDAALAKDLQDRIRRGTSPRHVPAKVIPVVEIPYTRSGKKLELAVKRVLHGEPVENLEAIANPQSLELYRNLPELQT